MKKESASFQIKDEMIFIKGDLCFQTISAVMELQTVFKNPSIHAIDLREVTKCDTAGLALLLEWFCAAKKMNKPIHYVNISQPILNYAAIHNLTNLLLHYAN